MADAEFLTINIADIEVEDGRARKDFGDVADLAESIKSTGLIQPLAVCRVEGGEKPFRLLAGERRLRAKLLNGDTTSPVRIFPAGLSPLELKTIELHENLYRKDFTWLEQITLQKEIHELQCQIHGKKISTLPDAPGQTIADTAAMLNRSKSSVAADIHLASVVEQFPELFAGCKNKNEATKLLGKIGETMIREELSKRIQQEGGSHDLLRRLGNSYIIKSFFDAAKGMDSGIFNLIEIDPPYAVGLTDVKKQESPANTQYKLDEYNEITPEKYPDFMQSMLSEAYRLAAEHAWMLVWFGSDPWFQPMYDWITATGWTTTRLVGIWTKGHGQSLNPNTRLANSYEMFFYAWKGQPALARPGSTNEYHYSPVPPQQKIHPTQRPIELMTDIYSTFAFEGSRVLIPCAGSGVGILAANDCKMNAVATDISPVYKDSYLIMVNEYLKNR